MTVLVLILMLAIFLESMLTEIRLKRGKMSKLDEAIHQTAYILDSLKVLRDIYNSGDCNDCANRDCEYRPELGKLVRFNCVFYKEKEV